MSIRKSSVCWALIALLLAACSGGGGGGGVSILSQPLPLDASYTTGNGRLAFNYPSSWRISENSGQILVATSQQVLDISDPSATPTPGQFTIGIDVFTAASLGLGANAAPSDVVTNFSQFLGTQSAPDSAPAFSAPRELTIGSRRAARAESTNTSSHTVLLAVEIDSGTFGLLVGGSAAGEMGQFEPTLLAIAESMRYSARGVVPTMAFPTQDPNATQEVGS